MNLWFKSSATLNMVIRAWHQLATILPISLTGSTELYSRLVRLLIFFKFFISLGLNWIGLGADSVKINYLVEIVKKLWGITQVCGEQAAMLRTMQTGVETDMNVASWREAIRPEFWIAQTETFSPLASVEYLGLPMLKKVQIVRSSSNKCNMSVARSWALLNVSFYIFHSQF